ncbi:hypothetical protein A2U01_0061901, partial [Trifolium medium]|nr:hypothetical protein [Trifolium medium]
MSRGEFAGAADNEVYSSIYLWFFEVFE